MKYIILDGPTGEAPVLFPREFMHRYVAELFAPMPVVAAGFVRDGPDGPECYGESAGLRLRSRAARDSALLHAALAVAGEEARRRFATAADAPRSGPADGEAGTQAGSHPGPETGSRTGSAPDGSASRG